MKTFNLVILLSLTTRIFGQDLPSNIKLTKDSDTTYWKNHYLGAINDLKLIEPNSDINFLRISSSKYFLEISPNSKKVSFYVKELWDNVQTGKSFMKSYDLNEDQIFEIEKLYKSLHIEEIPSDRHLNNWRKGFDGITYIIELKRGNSFSFKSYWTPSVQKECDESKKILEFTNQLDRIVDYSRKKEDFEADIPFYGWKYNNSMVIVKVVTNTKEFRKYKRMQKRKFKLKNNNP